MASDYKTAKESWVSDLTGSTVIHINFVSSVALYSILLYSSIVSRVPPSWSKKFLGQWIILVFPLLLSMTVYANIPAFLLFVLLIPASIAPFFPRQYVSSPLPSQNPMPSSPQSPQISPLPAVTIYRAHMMLMTILGILAVDFPVFPRALAKCETFGVSLMDLGVGSFVFSQGLVSAAPLLKNPSHLSAPAVPKILTITRKSLPIIFLGLVRVLLVKGTSYPEHESEYGTHWNFFITLALLPILQVVLHPVVKHVPVALLGILVAFAHQLTLSFLGMHQYVLHAPRVGIISANKEGLVSLAGYLGLHLLGLSTGTIILPPSSKYFSRELRKLGHSRRNSDAQYIANALSAPREINHTAITLFSYTFVWWTLFYAMKYLGVGVGVSRRMVNVQYIFWVAGFNTSFILGYLLLHMAFHPPPPVYSQQSKLKVSANRIDIDLYQTLPVPPLFEAINKNGLVLFLVANVATGLVNLVIPTMYTPDPWAMIILGVYSLVLSSFAWLFRDKRLIRL
ncbi:hypothetical protein H2248_001282 [Termitomyces sp. 'cryptogamus']|nr:hypothetical protein H2248_001282 [Termitomyces sp. 'cryptogamus']